MLTCLVEYGTWRREYGTQVSHTLVTAKGFDSPSPMALDDLTSVRLKQFILVTLLLALSTLSSALLQLACPLEVLFAHAGCKWH